jgi:hypothetical protein
MGMHGHGFCCEKGKKGEYMCCLVFKQGLHKWNSCPLLIILFKSENIPKKQLADIRAYPVDKDTTSVKPHSVLMKSPNVFVDSISSIHC